MNDTPTPRTDALLHKLRHQYKLDDKGFKQIELDLTAAREELAKYKSIAETVISDHELSEIRNHKLGEQLDVAREEIENLSAAGIHSCSDTCQRPNCVLRRENKILTEQRDEWFNVNALTTKKLGDMREQRDRLAAALRGFRKIHSELWDHGYVAAEAIAADEALQSLNQPNEHE